VSNLWVSVDELDQYADSEYAYEAVKTASQLLWSLSGRKFSGVTTVTERYVCASRAYRLGASARNYSPELVGGEVYNVPFDEFDDYAELTTDGMSPSTRLRLRGRPVAIIHEVRDRAGNIVNPSNYYLVDHSTIQARAGTAWTPCNIEVTYSYGSPPPASGKAAARVLATELVKLWNGDDCDLPSRITSIARQGVSYTVLDNQDFIDNMRTGLYVVDLFLKSSNPDKARAKARVFSPDVPRARRLVPKPYALAAGPLDMFITGSEGASLEVNINYINAGFLATNPEWIPSLHISNYTGSKTVDLGSGGVSLNDPTVTDVTKSIVYKELENNMVTITTQTAHGFLVNDFVTIAGINSTFNGGYYISDVPSETTFMYQKVADDVAYGADTGTATVTNETHDTLTLSVSYNDAYGYAGFVDPGTWDLYATRPSIADPSVDETVYIASGNLVLRLGNPVTPTYTLGS
jgi:hypothetical protein